MSKKQPPTTKIATIPKVELAEPLKNPNSVEALFEQYRPIFQRVAAHGLDVGRMAQVAIMACSRSQDLLKCTAVSLLGAFMQAAQMGLDFGMGEAHLVPFKNKWTKAQEVQLIPDYRGLIKLMRNSEQIKDIWARLVYKGERFSVVEGDNPSLDHKPDFSVSRRPADIIAAYTIATWTDNRMTFEVLAKEKIERAKKASASGDSGPWGTDYDEMAMKTAIKHRAKTLPRSAQLVSAIALDDRADLGRPQNIEILGDGMQAMAQLGPESIDVQPQAVVSISETQRGKILAWIKQYKWSEAEFRQMLKRRLPEADVSLAALADVVAQIPDGRFDAIIEAIEQGQPRAAADALPANGKVATPESAESKNDRAPDQGEPAGDNDVISAQQYDDLWTMVVDAKLTSQAQNFAKTLGYPKLSQIRRRDLDKVARFIQNGGADLPPNQK